MCGDLRLFHVKPNEQLAAVARRFELDEHQCDQLSALLELIAGDDLAPTAITEPEVAMALHLADSLVALELTWLRGASRIVDVGTGAGFPGLPLAIAVPGGELTLVDSQSRKCAFVARAIERARIENAHVVCARVEEWPEGSRANECVLARAVGPQSVVLEYAAPLLELEGRLIDWRGARDSAEERAALAAAEQLGMERVEIRPVQPFADARDLHLHVFLKRCETPARFPRRAGMARKRPLA